MTRYGIQDIADRLRWKVYLAGDVHVTLGFGCGSPCRSSTYWMLSMLIMRTSLSKSMDLSVILKLCEVKLRKPNQAAGELESAEQGRAIACNDDRLH